MTDLLHRVELHDPEQGRAVLTRSMLPWIGEQLKQGRALSTRYCCRCLRDRPTSGGRNSGLMFTCAECRESLAKAEAPK